MDAAVAGGGGDMTDVEPRGYPVRAWASAQGTSQLLGFLCFLPAIKFFPFVVGVPSPA